MLTADRFWAALGACGVGEQARYLESAAFRLDPRHTLDLAASIVDATNAPALDALACADAEAAFARLAAPRMVCRSSAAMEDGREAAFPGVFVSVLDLTSPEDLGVAIADCWRSVFSADALRYLLRVGSEPVDFSMAVLLQRQVDAAWYGVYVSVDPLTGMPEPRADLSHAGPEALVGGGGATLRARRPNGRWSGVDEAMAASLDAVHRAAARLAAHLQTEVDLEFALPLAGQEPVILQCRPVTRNPVVDTPGLSPGSGLAGRSCSSGYATGMATGGEGAGIAVMEQVTTADYVVLFRSVGVVSEHDASPLSHIAILCRELGIPFICGVEGARADLVGRRVAMDGRSGQIQIIDESSVVPSSQPAPAMGDATLSAVELLLRLLAEGRPGHPPAAEAERIARRYARALGSDSVGVIRQPIAPLELERLEQLGAELFGSDFSAAVVFPNRSCDGA